MYTEEYLRAYPFFQELLRSTELSAIHDSLTGLIARPYMIEFIRDLIDRQVPFTLAILDLDNFKSVNDNYGHKAGDGVLAQVSEDLRRYVGDTGMVGRFGGDEFLVLYFKSVDYDEVHDFYDGMYRSRTVLRKNIKVGDLSIYMTGTVGSASYPKDGADYDALFALVDKTLYRGKSKGRNCYIIYVEAKHGHLEIPKLAKGSLCDTFQRMAGSFDGASGVRRKLRDVFDVMSEYLGFYAMFCVDGGGRLVDSGDGSVLARVTDVDRRVAGDLYAASRLMELEDLSHTLYEALRPMRYQAAIVARVGKGETTYGYLVVCPEPRTMRIWQDDEQAAVFFLARMLADYLSAEGKSLE